MEGFDTINMRISESLASDGIDATAILALQFIAGDCRVNGFCDKHNSDFAKALGIKERAFRDLRKRLENGGYISVEHGGFARGRKSAKMRITQKTIDLWSGIWGSFTAVNCLKKRQSNAHKNGSQLPPLHKDIKTDTPTGAHTRKGGCAPSVVYNEDGVPIL